MKKSLALFSAGLCFLCSVPINGFAEMLEQEQPEQATNEEVITDNEIETPVQNQEENSELDNSFTEDSENIEDLEVTEEVTSTVELAEESYTETENESQEILISEPISVQFERNQQTEEFITRIGEQAREVGLANDLFASVMIAQAILESGSGNSDLSQEPYNNLFGIKGTYEGNFVIFPTFEDDGFGNYYQIDSAFRQYPSVKESFEDYGELLKDGIIGNETIYQDTWKSVASTYQNATEALTGTYATDIYYGDKLNGLIETYNLTQYDHENEIVAGGDFEPYNNINYDTRNSYAWGNCTQYVYNRITQLGGYVDLDMGNGGEWSNTGLIRGYEVNNTPKAGTAVSFTPGLLGADSTYGHVAFVEHVYEDGSILISEMNAVGLNVVSERKISVESARTLLYVTPKKGEN